MNSRNAQSLMNLALQTILLDEVQKKVVGWAESWVAMDGKERWCESGQPSLKKDWETVAG